MERLQVDDVLLQTLVTLINLGARKAGLATPPGEEGRATAISSRPRQAIDGARALLPLLEPRHGQELGADQGRALAPADGLRAAFRRNAGRPPQPEPRKARADRARRSRPDASGSRASKPRGRLRALLRRPGPGRRFALSESREVLVSSFLSDHGALLAVVCALLAVAYGVVTTRSLLALSPGNETMQRLSRGRPGGRSGVPAAPVHGRSAPSASSCSSR